MGMKKSSQNTKNVERLQRSIKSCSMEIIFNETMQSTVNQEVFLANEQNKTRLIHMLSSKFEKSNITVNQALDDADTLIVNTAIDLSLTNETVILVGDDIDLLIILTGLAPTTNNIFFMKLGKGTIERRIYSSDSLQSQKDTKKSILFVHAFCGCDTTSSFYRKGKVQCFKIIEKRPYLLQSIEKFYDPIASKDSVCKADEMFILALYNASEKETNLNNYRYQYFAKNVSSSKNVLLTLPPSEAAAREHSFRAYHQIQMWLENDKLPVEWGWHVKNDLLLPIPLKGPLIPEILLNLISCNCTKGCTASCGCRKHGLKCSMICGYCKGNSCQCDGSH